MELSNHCTATIPLLRLSGHMTSAETSVEAMSTLSRAMGRLVLRSLGRQAVVLETFEPKDGPLLWIP
jgi:hypothetical protein